MKALLGILFVAAGLIAGAYVGVWLCFIGGIIGIVRVIVDLCHGQQFHALALGFSILKIMGAGLAGYLSAFALILPGIALIENS